jgi:uridine kinase
MDIHSPAPIMPVSQPSGSFRNLIEPLLVLFNAAVKQELNNKPYYIAYSIPGGVYGYFKEAGIREEDLNRIRQCMNNMIVSKIPFSHQMLDEGSIRTYFQKHPRADILNLLDSINKPNHICPELNLAYLNGSGELFLNHISENYQQLEKFQIIRHNSGFFLIADPDFFSRVMPARKELSKYLKRFEESENTMTHLGISSFAELNDVIHRGELPEFIKIAEAYQAKSISRIADNIVSHPLKARVIFLSGPTSSGKTTSANRLAIELKVLRKDVLILSMDNFYLPHSAIADDPVTGIKNFENISALDLELFRITVQGLLAGLPINLPRYMFDGNGSVKDNKTTTITPETYLIIEGIHGLNPAIWQQDLGVDSYRLYVSALSTLNIHDHLPFSTSDHRLIRRLVRDHLFRGYDFNDTINRWPDVIQNEYTCIFPYQESANAIFNSALIYEIAVFAHYAPSILNVEKAQNERIRQEVKRLNRILGLLTPIDPVDIPPTSVLREFIGGSSFIY